MIEELILKAIKQSQIVINEVAKYKDEPAVFYSTFPNDKSKGWGKEQFPKINYVVDWTYNAERKAAGNLQIDIWTQSISLISPEDIANALTTDLSELFLTKDNNTYCIVWNRSDLFDGENEKEPKTIGITVTFDILAFPSQKTLGINPIEAFVKFSKIVIPNGHMIGFDETDELFKPTSDNPAIYFRFTGGNGVIKNTYACTWIHVNLSMHIITSDTNARLNLITNFVNVLAKRGEVVFDTGSPIFIKALSYNTSSNPLSDGQISITGEYGIMTEEIPCEPLNNINLKQV